MREKERAMAFYPKSIGPLVVRLLAVLLLLSCPRMGSAAGTWSVISLPQKPGEVVSPAALATDAAGDFNVADNGTGNSYSGIHKRDAQGNWSILATEGTDPGQVSPYLRGLAADTTGNLYVASDSRVQKRDVQGNWSVIAAPGMAPRHVDVPTALAADTAGNLYTLDAY
jgi:hypothetical protein